MAGKGMRDETVPWNADDFRVEDALSRRGRGHSPRPQTEKDTTSTGSFAQAFLRKAENLFIPSYRECSCNKMFKMLAMQACVIGYVVSYFITALGGNR